MDETALLIIDAQQEYFAPIGKIVLPDGPQAITRIAKALEWARSRRVPVFHIVHESRRPNATTFVPGSPALAIHPAVTPQAGEPVIQKHLIRARKGQAHRTVRSTSFPAAPSVCAPTPRRKSRASTPTCSIARAWRA